MDIMTKCVGEYDSFYGAHCAAIIQSAMDDATQAERERCILECGKVANPDAPASNDYENGYESGCLACALAIREEDKR